MQIFVVSHSWGDTVFRCFMAWISVKDPKWVEANLAVYANIAGPTLGVPKALSSFLSGACFDLHSSLIAYIPRLFDSSVVFGSLASGPKLQSPNKGALYSQQPARGC